MDLTLYDLKSGAVIEMPSTYDESTPRAYAFYPGGTSLQRWHRALLRRLMEAEGFAVNPEEWWHFDHQDWRRYAIGKDEAHGFTNLRDWFQALYETLLGSSAGPRMGSFIALYGVENTRELIAEALG